MTVANEHELLGGKYRVKREIGTDQDGSTVWRGVDVGMEPVLLKLWAFEGESPEDLDRALWDTSLRVLYRVSSAPGGRKALLRLEDAGVDRKSRTFVMALKGDGRQLSRLSDHLRDNHPGRLSAADRLPGWRVLRRLADGVHLLHRQDVLHRNIGPEVAFLDPGLGIETLRLGGFEWSIRVGMTAHTVDAGQWAWPPEFLDGDGGLFGIGTDWFGFGVLAVRLLLNVENHRDNRPRERYERTVAAVDQAGAALTNREQELLAWMISEDRDARVDRYEDIVNAMDGVITALSRPGARTTAPTYVVAMNPNFPDYLERAVEAGFEVSGPSGPGGTPPVYKGGNPVHAAALLDFYRRDFHAQPRLVWFPDNRAALVGDRFALSLVPFLDAETERETWDMAYCRLLGEVRMPPDTAAVDLPPGSVVFRSVRQAYEQQVRAAATPWDAMRPAVVAEPTLSQASQLVFDVFRAANQIELLLRDAEIFPFTTRAIRRDGAMDVIEVVEGPRSRDPLSFARVTGRMAGFLVAELATGKPRAEEVVLGPSDTLRVWAERDQEWKIDQIDEATGVVTLWRNHSDVAAPDSGFLRTMGHLLGQTGLMLRRKESLRRLEEHAYLLDALANPVGVFMDVGDQALPVPLDPARVDKSKTEVIDSILRTRPLYAVQGPPGTGKTTMVAWLIREILAEDPVAQILVTAQAHGAVDVLRDKVHEEAFAGAAADEHPLAVRLRGEDEDVGGGINDVTVALLKQTRERLTHSKRESAVQQTWLAEVDRLLDSIDPTVAEEDDGSAADFREVVRRAAAITYCTTSDRGLEAIARLNRSFDWAIVEEAGKAHSFDLTMSLQAGHRWLLIGDHYQLQPYRFNDYGEAVRMLDHVGRELRLLPERGGRLVDEDWLSWWEALTSDKKADFKSVARAWLEPFRVVFEACEVADGGDGIRNPGQSTVGATGMLTGQHRMHPDIGSLVSDVYYEGQVQNRTEQDNGIPMSRVQHGLTAPNAVAGTAIVWLDTPWSNADRRFAEVEERPYSNPMEARILCDFLRRLAGGDPSGRLTYALLSPYNAQLRELRRDLQQQPLTCERLVAKAQRHRRSGSLHRQPVFTVDSFQGAQADIIGISLVRNNDRPAGDGLGFLRERARMNVLLSRAERLLVLAGSWDFFANQVAAVPTDDPTHPLAHLRNVVRWFDDAFTTGRAVRIEGDRP